jgi:hypothetical protein
MYLATKEYGESGCEGLGILSIGTRWRLVDSVVFRSPHLRTNRWAEPVFPTGLPWVNSSTSWEIELKFRHSLLE